MRVLMNIYTSFISFSACKSKTKFEKSNVYAKIVQIFINREFA